MSIAPEGSRVIREGIIVSVPMDWCKSPDCIVPYKIYTHHQVEGANNADSVRQTDAVSHVKESLILKSYGDEPGVGGGCVSGTHNAECTPKTWSETVRFEDRNAVRHDDLWWMNHKNTWGRLQYTKDTNSYPTEESKQTYPRMQFAAYQAPNTATDAPSSLAGSAAPGTEQAFFRPLPGLRLPPGLAPRGPVVPRIPPRLAPRPGPKPGPEPEPKPGPGPRPSPPPPGNRTSGCRSELICFDPGKYDETEYRRQLKLQQDKLNSKTSCQAEADINKFDAQSPSEKIAQRGRANKYRDDVFMPNYRLSHPGVSTAGKNALHRLDMVAGGYETDFAEELGDGAINQSIGPSWNADSRKGKLTRYAAEMCRKGCRMSVTLDICETPLGGEEIA